MTSIASDPNPSNDPLDELLRQCWEPLHRWAKSELSRNLRKRMTSEDLVQDTILSFLPTLRALHPKSFLELESVLRCVLRNRARDASDRFMAQKRRLDREVDITTSTMNGLREAGDREKNPEALAMDQEERARLNLAIMMCPQSYREVLIVYLEEDGRTAGMATSLAIGADAARKRLARALWRAKGIAKRLRSGDLRGASALADEDEQAPPNGV